VRSIVGIETPVLNVDGPLLLLRVLRDEARRGVSPEVGSVSDGELARRDLETLVESIPSADDVVVHLRIVRHGLIAGLGLEGFHLVRIHGLDDYAYAACVVAIRDKDPSAILKARCATFGLTL
jgi:hypothetical protein